MKNFFITLEGCEGVGKSTALSFIAKYLTELNWNFVLTREPGGTPIAESIREILLHHDEEKLLPVSELLLMFASRAQHIAHVVRPALESGKSVISDRFTDASFAYQGGGRCVSKARLQTLVDWVQGDLQPDLTLLFDAPIELGLSRIYEKGGLDRIESEKKDFFERVRKSYLERAAEFPERFVIIDATKELGNVEEQIRDAIGRLK